MVTSRNMIYVLILASVCLKVKGADTGNEQNIKIPSNCRKEYFITNFVEKNVTLTQEDRKTFEDCSKYYPTCKSSTQKLLYSYAESDDGKFVLLIYVLNYVSDGCWGSIIQIKDQFQTKSIYFNFQQKIPYYMEKVYVRLGFKYEVTVQSLPKGQEFAFRTTAPNICELEVLSNIYNKLQHGKIFKSCDTPGFTARHDIAKKICKAHPHNSGKRYKMTKHRLIEENCQFVLLPKNKLNNEVHIKQN